MTKVPDAAVVIDHVSKSYRVRGKTAKLMALNDVNLTIARGETLGLVGESGSGKSTLGRIVAGLERPSSGEVVVDGLSAISSTGKITEQVHQHVQMVFQDPYSSFDPSSTLKNSLREPLRNLGVPKGEQETRIAELAGLVGLPAEMLDRRPVGLSGGQLQRLAIARVLALDPAIVVCDEAVSALDVSTQGRVVNLLMDLQKDRQLSYLFISHDLGIVRRASTQLAVMYLGQIVEQGPVESVYTAPRHPYTLALLSAIPRPTDQDRRERIRLDGEIPSPISPPAGCRFHTRCPFVMPVCRTVEPPVFLAEDGVSSRCHLHTSGPVLSGASVKDLPMPTVRATV